MWAPVRLHTRTQIDIAILFLHRIYLAMSMFDKLKKGAQKAGQQASVFIKDGSSKIATEGQNFVQGFSLPGEAEKAAKILASFLGESSYPTADVLNVLRAVKADPEHPESALNSIPKVVLQRARGMSFHAAWSSPLTLRACPQDSQYSRS